MFDAADGFFHLLFANCDDDYYTPGYIRMHFLSYLRWQMYSAGFRNVFLLFPAEKSCAEDYQMQWVGSQSYGLLMNEQKKGFFSSIFKSKADDSTLTDCAIDRELLSEDQLAERLCSVLSAMKGSTAVAMPAVLLEKLTQQNERLLPLLAGQAHRRGSVMILTVQPKASEADALFRIPNAEMRGADLPPGFLCRPDLFPEIADALRNQTVYRIDRYAAVQQALGPRMLCWNSLSYAAVQAAVRYAYIRHPEQQDCGSADVAAAILWAWHTDPYFRDRHFQLGCRENPLRKRSILTDNLSDPAFRLRLAETVQQEMLTDPVQFVSQFPDVPPLCIRRAETAQDIVGILTQYRALLRGHESLLEPEELRSLIEMTEEFRMPDFLHAHNASEPTFCKFRSAESRKPFTDLFNSLRGKDDWNGWDSGIMYLLFILFTMCRQDAKARPGTDDYHLTYDKIFLKTAEAVRFCMIKSAEAPFEAEEAAHFTQKTAEVFRSKDYNTIRNYPIR